MRRRNIRPLDNNEVVSRHIPIHRPNKSGFFRERTAAPNCFVHLFQAVHDRGVVLMDETAYPRDRRFRDLLHHAGCYPAGVNGVFILCPRPHLLGINMEDGARSVQYLRRLELAS
jgi:hypothetical protein